TLREVNDKLAAENASLRDQLKGSMYVDTVAKGSVTDTVYKQQYNYITAKVINNSVNRRNNTITINVGSDAGVQKGQGVITKDGVVGKIVLVSPHFSVVQSLLHSEFVVSAMLANSTQLGSFSWGSNINPHVGLLYDVPNDPAPPIRPYMMASLRDMRRWSTSDRVVGKRNKAISSLTTVDTAVSRAIAFRNLLLLIGSGIERPAERSIREIESKTAYQHSSEEDSIPRGRAIKLGIVRPA
ncbi:MAG: rod shape-determining protein MreC, partial [Hymenobacter sp.]